MKKLKTKIYTSFEYSTEYFLKSSLRSYLKYVSISNRRFHLYETFFVTCYIIFLIIVKTFSFPFIFLTFETLKIDFFGNCRTLILLFFEKNLYFLELFKLRFLVSDRRHWQVRRGRVPRFVRTSQRTGKRYIFIG